MTKNTKNTKLKPPLSVRLRSFCCGQETISVYESSAGLTDYLINKKIGSNPGSSVPEDGNLQDSKDQHCQKSVDCQSKVEQKCKVEPKMFPATCRPLAPPTIDDFDTRTCSSSISTIKSRISKTISKCSTARSNKYELDCLGDYESCVCDCACKCYSCVKKKVCCGNAASLTNVSSKMDQIIHLKMDKNSKNIKDRKMSQITVEELTNLISEVIQQNLDFAPEARALPQSFSKINCQKGPSIFEMAQPSLSPAFTANQSSPQFYTFNGSPTACTNQEYQGGISEIPLGVPLSEIGNYLSQIQSMDPQSVIDLGLQVHDGSGDHYSIVPQIDSVDLNNGSLQRGSTDCLTMQLMNLNLEPKEGCTENCTGSAHSMNCQAFQVSKSESNCGQENRAFNGDDLWETTTVTSVIERTTSLECSPTKKPSVVSKSISSNSSCSSEKQGQQSYQLNRPCSQAKACQTDIIVEGNPKSEILPLSSASSSSSSKESHHVKFVPCQKTPKNKFCPHLCQTRCEKDCENVQNTCQDQKNQNFEKSEGCGDPQQKKKRGFGFFRKLFSRSKASDQRKVTKSAPTTRTVCCCHNKKIDSKSCNHSSCFQKRKATDYNHHNLMYDSFLQTPGTLNRAPQQKRGRTRYRDCRYKAHHQNQKVESGLKTATTRPKSCDSIFYTNNNNTCTNENCQNPAHVTNKMTRGHSFDNNYNNLDDLNCQTEYIASSQHGSQRPPTSYVCTDTNDYDYNHNICQLEYDPYDPYNYNFFTDESPELSPIINRRSFSGLKRKYSCERCESLKLKSQTHCSGQVSHAGHSCVNRPCSKTSGRLGSTRSRYSNSTYSNSRPDSRNYYKIPTTQTPNCQCSQSKYRKRQLSRSNSCNRNYSKISEEEYVSFGNEEGQFDNCAYQESPQKCPTTYNMTNHNQCSYGKTEFRFTPTVTDFENYQIDECDGYETLIYNCEEQQPNIIYNQTNQAIFTFENTPKESLATKNQRSAAINDSTDCLNKSSDGESTISKNDEKGHQQQRDKEDVIEDFYVTRV